MSSTSSSSRALQQVFSAHKLKVSSGLPPLEPKGRLAAGAKVMLMSHLGRPKEGEYSEENSMQPVADRLSELLGKPVRAWVDSGDIDTGSPFAEAIEQGIEDTSLLCVLTDHYSTRAWCRQEIILAKLHQRPVVVVAAFSRQEVRSFPYLGNVPVLRWPCISAEAGDAEKAQKNRTAAVAAVDLVLKETLRHLHATALLRQVEQPGDVILARPPELLSLLRARNATAVLYPDPPLGREELALLSETRVATTTPLSRLAEQRPLQGRRIALSMSESTDIQCRGLDEVHLREAMVELSRYLLLWGAPVVYGVLLGDAGYTQPLFVVVRAHHCLDGIARDIRAGRWMLNAQPICVSAGGTLLNGQHRLLAVVAAGIAIEVPIARFLPDEAFGTYDRHAKRGLELAGSLESFGDRALVAAMANLLWRRELRPAGRRQAKATAAEIHAIVQQHPRLLELRRFARRMVDHGRSSVLGYGAYIIERENAELSKAFLRALETGAGLPDGHPVLALRRTLQRLRRAGASQDEQLEAMLEGWTRFKDRQSG